MPINIYTLANHLQEENWQLVSDSYKNLNTELEMICPKGHRQFQTYGNWRKHPICEQCMAGDPYKIKKNNVPPKNDDTQRVLALDAATVITGYSIFDDGVLVSYVTYKVNKDLDTDARINAMKKWLAAALQEWEPDFVGLENIQLQSFGKGQYQVEMYRVLANLQGVLIDTIFEACIDHDLVYSATWRNYCNVGDDKGRENKKKAAQDKVKLWYNQDCTQDEADAICIGKYFVHLLKNNKSSWGEEI